MENSEGILILKSVKRPRGVTIIGIITIFAGLAEFYEGVGELASGGAAETSKKQLEGYVSGLWMAGIGVAATVIGVATLRAKPWAWKSNIVTQIFAIVLPTAYLASTWQQTLSGLEQSPLSFEIFIAILVALYALNIITLAYLFKPSVRAYFGKSDFSFARIIKIDAMAARHDLKHLWIAGIISGALFSSTGLFLLYFDELLEAVIMFDAAAISVGLAFLTYRTGSQRTAILTFATFVIGAISLVVISARFLEESAFWIISIKSLGVPLFQGIRATSAIRKFAVV